jgi:hypothetical protein
MATSRSVSKVWVLKEYDSFMPVFELNSIFERSISVAAANVDIQFEVDLQLCATCVISCVIVSLILLYANCSMQICSLLSYNYKYVKGGRLEAEVDWWQLLAFSILSKEIKQQHLRGVVVWFIE